MFNRQNKPKVGLKERQKRKGGKKNNRQNKPKVGLKVR